MTPALDVPPHANRLRRLGIDIAYVLVGFPVAIVAFVLVVTGLARDEDRHRRVLATLAHLRS